MRESTDSSLDGIDIALLRLLQADAGRSVSSLAEQVSLSTNAVWRRIRSLEQDGYIRQRVALLDAERLGLGVTVFVSIRTSEHNAEWLERFGRGVAALQEVTEIHRMSGEIDYLLKVRVRDIRDYDRVYKRLIEVAPMSDVSSSFAMEEIKSTTALPI